MRPAILTHAGAGSPNRHAGACRRAARAARTVLARGGDALEAALAATVVLENDPRFNAGTGANLRLDGQTIEMDAAVMTSDAAFGAVACIQRVKNPILVAARVLDTPHLMLVGEGATAFARRLGFEDYDPVTDEAKKKFARRLAALGRDSSNANHSGLAFRRIVGGQSVLRRFWNFPGDPPDIESRDVDGPRTTHAEDAGLDVAHAADDALGEDAQDTVGAVVRDREGRFAATASTGGTPYTLRGRVGDSPLLGAGVYAGPHGAVAATGTGEEILRRLLSKTVYDWLTQGVSPLRAARRALASVPDTVDVGLLVASKRGQVALCNRSMASTIELPS